MPTDVTSLAPTACPFRPLPGHLAIPFDISHHGVAVGSVEDASGFQRGIIWPKALTRP